MRDEATNALRDEEEDAEGRRLAPDAQYFLVREQEKNEKRKFSMQIFFGERERERDRHGPTVQNGKAKKEEFKFVFQQNIVFAQF